MVPAIEALLPTVNVVEVLVPPAIVKPVVCAVGVNPLIVLFVNASEPVKVANVPVLGSVTVVFAVVVNVVLYAPDVVKFPPSVIVLPVLAIPVPPLAPNTIPETLVALPDSVAVIVPAVKFPVASLLTIVLAVFALVAALANNSAACKLLALDPPTVTTVGVAAVPPKSPAQ